MEVAIVTGAAAGIGAACAKRLAQDGIAIRVLDLDSNSSIKLGAKVLRM